MKDRCLGSRLMHQVPESALCDAAFNAYPALHTINCAVCAYQRSSNKNYHIICMKDGGRHS